MFSEMLMILFIMLLSSQSSALWSSLIIIPLSMSVILSSSNMNIYSGLFVFMFFMVFISGLMVLLLSVASISYQEQNYNLMKKWVMMGFILFFPFMIFYKNPIINLNSLIISASWLEYQSSLYLIMILIISISLMMMSKLILTFKGLIRSM